MPVRAATIAAAGRALYPIWCRCEPPRRPERAQMTDRRTLYDEDFVAWSKQRADALRAAALTGSKQQLDWENLAEEVEGLGIPERRALPTQIERIIRHLLKLEFSLAADPRRSWIETVNDARHEIELVLEMSPSLRPEVEP